MILFDTLHIYLEPWLSVCRALSGSVASLLGLQCRGSVGALSVNCRASVGLCRPLSASVTVGLCRPILTGTLLGTCRPVSVCRDLCRSVGLWVCGSLSMSCGSMSGALNALFE